MPCQNKTQISIIAQGAPSAFLDFARGIAATLVLFFHIRSALLVPFGEMQSHDIQTTLFFVITTFGHDAVIIFFVLSGYLVGGAVLRMNLRSVRDARKYLIDRFVRIFPVLIAAVAYSVLLLGVELLSFGHIGCRAGPTTIAGNLIALQNFVVLPLCNNLPLWSISNEVFYYLAFPVFVAIFVGVRSPYLLALLLLVMLLTALSLASTPLDDRNSVLYFPIWLLGTAAYLIAARWRVSIWIALIFFSCALAFGRINVSKDWFWLRDAMLAVSFCAVLVSVQRLKLRPTRAGKYAAITSQWLSAISFSLYVTHYPLIIFYTRYLQSWSGQVSRRSMLTSSVVLESLCLAISCILIATIFSFVFERPRYWIRDRLETLLTKRDL